MAIHQLRHGIRGTHLYFAFVSAASHTPPSACAHVHIVFKGLKIKFSGDCNRF